ncbi:hypothetical protein ACHAXR_006897 [Thalassiosira sp. AJA248-18]
MRAGKNNSKSNGDKGNYGRITTTSKDRGRKQHQRSSNNNNNNSPGNNKTASTTTSSHWSRKKAKTNTGKGGSATANSGKNKSSSSPSAKKKKAAAAADKKGNKGNKKVVPKSKHHNAKRNRTSIKERVAAASASSSASKKKNRSTSSSSRSNNNNSSSSRTMSISSSKTNKDTRSKKHKNGKKKIVQYRMSLSECNDDVYLQRSDVPWNNAEAQERFRDNITTTKYRRGVNDDDDDDESVDSESNNNHKHNAKKSRKDGSTTTTTTTSSSSLLQLPSERILQHIDAEIHSFGVYVKLTPSERKARSAFLEHVTNLAVEQFEKNNNPSSNNQGRRNIVVDAGRRGSQLFRGGKFRQRNDHNAEVVDEDEEEIHVAPFGSFATQDVCVFASDVDMCLWGVVKGAKKKSDGVELFVGGGGGGAVIGNGGDDDDDCSDSENEDHGEEDDSDVVVLDSGSHSGPLLTESALLRTMDAIQSAAHNATTTTTDTTETKTQQSNIDSKDDDDCLFFIDRVGEGGADAKSSAEVIDLSSTIEQGNEGEKKTSSQPQSRKCDHDDADAEIKPDDKVGAATKDAAPPAAAEFQFVIDTEGVKELGGEVEDLTTKSSNAEQTTSSTDRQLGKETTENCKAESRRGADQKIEEPKIDDSTEQKEDQDSFEPGKFSALGKSAQDAIDINDDSNDDGKGEVIVVESDCDDDDSADKMSSYYSRKEANPVTAVSMANNSSDARASPINLLDDDSSSEDEKEETLDFSSEDDESLSFLLSSKTPRASNEVLELSLTSKSPKRTNNVKPVIGPTGKARVHVISALQKLTRELRRSNFTHTIECRSKARVPIINCSTRTGFEGDIAIGGHNGVDTSMYAMSQVKRFHSFAPIVLIMKVLMAQQGFDKPFTGGLGSYKLYVLVAYHIERHIANGGTDRPSEILISILFRYGCIGTNYDKATTDLEQLRNKDDSLSSHGGMCELTPVFRLSDCVDMFRECHARLLGRILVVDDFGGDGEKISYLSSIIDCYLLREARETSDRRSKMCDSVYRPIAIARNDSGKVNAGRRIGKVFSKLNNVKRGPRGSIVPKKRPDLQAKHSLRSNRETEVIQRAMKNRKNNKKQKRDEEFRRFASRRSI